MQQNLRLHAAALSALVLASVAPPILAQQALYVAKGDTALLVREVRDQTPMVEENGKLVPVDSYRYLLNEIPEYAPIFISVRHVQTDISYVESMGDNKQTNRTFKFFAEFEANFNLERVFLVLDITRENSEEKLFVQEVGNLVARVPKNILFKMPFDQNVGPFKYVVHLFVDGREVLHSEIPFDYREQVLNRMIAARIKDVRNAPSPRPFMGPAPEYPAALRKAKVKGEAVVGMRIDIHGNVQDPCVKSASDPAFGESAVAALRLWRFLPRVKDGSPVETKAQMRFDFAN